MTQRNGQESEKAAKRVTARKAFGISLLVRARSRSGSSDGPGAVGEGTGFRLEAAGASRFGGESMPLRLR
jgi:hypothetical protein